MSPFSTHSISTPSPHSRTEAMSEEETRWGVEEKSTSQHAAMTQLAAYKAPPPANEKRCSSSPLTTGHCHRPILCWVQQSFSLLCCTQMKISALHCQTFIPEQCHSSYHHTAFQLWLQRSMHGLTQCIIQRSSPPQRGRNSLQRFCTNKQQKFLKLFSRFLMWCCVSSLYVQLSKQDLCRDVKDVWKVEQVRKELAEDWFHAFYLSISISTWRAVTLLSTEEWMFPSAVHCHPPGDITLTVSF